MRRPGIEPGPSAWKADILTTRPTTRGGETCAGKPLKKENYLIEYKMDLSGFEPEAFCMQSRRDTTTPQAQSCSITNPTIQNLVAWHLAEKGNALEKKGCSGDRTRDLPHPKRESYH